MSYILSDVKVLVAMFSSGVIVGIASAVVRTAGGLF